MDGVFRANAARPRVRNCRNAVKVMSASTETAASDVLHLFVLTRSGPVNVVPVLNVGKQNVRNRKSAFGKVNRVRIMD